MKKILSYLSMSIFLFSCNISKEKQGGVEVDSMEIYRKINLDIESKRAFEGAEIVVDTVGKYLYIDKNYCLHTKRNCLALLIEDAVVLSTSNEEAQLTTRYCKYALHRVEKNDLTKVNLRYCCRECVDDVVYERLLSLVEDEN